MSYLVDTNVLSELRRPRPNAAMAAWVAARPVTKLYLSVLTLGEMRKGVETVADPIHRQRPLGLAAGGIAGILCRPHASH